MIRRKLSQLAIYECEEQIDALPFAYIRDLYLEKTAEIVYINRAGKLYGIVCLGDVLKYSRNEKVLINKNFTFLIGYNAIRANQIFRRKSNIHKVPVVNGEGVLIGDYSRWDDIYYIRRNQEWVMQEDALKEILSPYEMIYIIKPIEYYNDLYFQFLKYMSLYNIEYTVLNKEQVASKLSVKALCVFFNEDEMRGTQCLHKIVVDSQGFLCNTQSRIKFLTYKNLLMQIESYIQQIHLGRKESCNLSSDIINEKTFLLLSALQKKGIKCFCLYSNGSKSIEYEKDFKKELRERLKDFPLSLTEPWPKKDSSRKYYENFYDGLFQIGDYENEIVQREVCEGARSYEVDKNITGKYFNAKEGRRITCFQPSNYVGTIYLLGRCTLVGYWVEDQYTISSLLQKKLNDEGYAYRVENCGGMLRSDGEIDSRLQEIGKYSKNDILIVFTAFQVEELPGECLVNIFEKNNVPSTWCTDAIVHCNHKGNKVIADSIFDMIEKTLFNKSMLLNKEKSKAIDICNIMKEYVRRKYLNRYFTDFLTKKYHTIGAIVMSCSPFSMGHRYLIEAAKAKVEFLIVFLLEEDINEIGFEERYEMTANGTNDINNIMIVPAGDFVLSKNNFPEFYIRHDLTLAFLNAEYDIRLFAECIAKPLNITHRFAGEENEDGVKKIYNQTMQRILPQYGITFEEISKYKINGEIVKTSFVRKLLKQSKYTYDFEMLPNTTVKFLL